MEEGITVNEPDQTDVKVAKSEVKKETEGKSGVSEKSLAVTDKLPPTGQTQYDAATNSGRTKPLSVPARTSELQDTSRVRGSMGSMGSNDGKSCDEDFVLSYQDEAVDVCETGAGSELPTPETAVSRLLLVSSKIRNVSSIRHALLSNVVYVQYKYDSANLEGILGLVSQTLGGRKVASMALVFPCSGSSLQLCGKEEKLQVLVKENFSDNQPVRDFFSTLVSSHLDLTHPGRRFDILACNLLSHSESLGLDKDLEALLAVPVHIYKDLVGSDLPLSKPQQDEAGKTISVVGEFYFKLEKLRRWSGQQQQTLAGFEKIQTVGKGAYGAAVLYKKKDDDSLVILKEINMHDLKASERQLALNEVNILAMLEHPNIISYYDSFEEDGVIMIEMEYADGGTLAQFLAQKEEPMEEKDILAMFQQIVAAIRHIHTHNILHRDLKTANIFLTKEGVVKVGDFGISKMMSTANKGANTVLGTPYYISPEMCEGKPYNDKSDIWALGCILYEIACLQKTFEGSNLPALVNKIMKGQFAPVKENYSQETKDLIMDMLSQDPEKRPSANELMYQRLPVLMSKFEDTASEYEDDLTLSSGIPGSKKKTRSVLYYFDSATALMTPIELNPKIKIRTAAVGADHLIVVTAESQVFTWGKGSKGQLGHGDLESRTKPELVEALKGKSIARAACGEGFSVFSSDRGIVLTCGDGSQGCLGHADWSATYRPRLIESLLSVDVIAVACGRNHVVVVGSEGEVFAWGCGVDGRLGLGNEENHCQPMKVTVSEPVLIRDVFCGVDGTMLLTDVGSVFACGSNTDNKLGLNNRSGFIMAMRNIFTRTEVEGQKVPTSVRAMARYKVLDISMGAKHTAVIVEPGHVLTFGRNVEGQLGIDSTKPMSAPSEVKTMQENSVNRVQCGEYFTVASTSNNELYYWGLRYKSPSKAPPSDESEGRSGNNASGPLTKDDVKKGNAIPRNTSSHSRQTSVSSISSVTSTKDTSNQNDVEPVKETRTAERQTSVESTASAQTDSGYMEDSGALSETMARSGFKPLSSVPHRSPSASSRENAKEKERDNDAMKDDSEIIFPPNHLMKILKSADEALTISSFFCHGENLFIQLETTAPPPRRRSRKKRGIRKRYSGNTLPVPETVQGMTPSSREGEEYSSEASEMDTKGEVPTWIRKELELSDQDAIDECEAGDDSDQSEDNIKRDLIDTSMSSIQINPELTPGKVPPDRTFTHRGVSNRPIKSTVRSMKEPPLSARDVRVRSMSNNSTESELEYGASDSSSKDVRLTSLEKTGQDAVGEGRKATTVPRASYLATSSARVRSASSSAKRPINRSRPQTRGYIGQDLALKEQLAARGFVSDVTVKRREDALLGELEMTREEKKRAESKLRELEDEHRLRQERLQQEAEMRALEREAQLQAQIQMLQTELQSQNSQLQNNQKVVSALQNQLSKLENKKQRRSKAGLTGSTGGTDKESKVCTVQ